MPQNQCEECTSKSIEIYNHTARLFSEISQNENCSLYGPIPQVVDTMIMSCLEKFLMDTVNPDQFDQAKNPHGKCELAIAFLRAMRGVQGYHAVPRFGPYVVYRPDCVTSNEKIEQQLA